MEPINRLIRSFIRWFFRHLYTDFAWTYDFVSSSVSLGLWNHWVKCVLPEITHSPVLEIGHGTGHLQQELWQSGYQVVGLDSSWQMNWLASLRMKDVGGDLVIVNGYAQNMPFKDEAFGNAVSTFPAEFIFEPATISEIWRTLRPGGAWVWLPTAWITGRDLVSRAFAGLFRLTGQAPPEIALLPAEFLMPIREAGFEISQELRQLRNSCVLIVTARKPIQAD